MFHSALQFVNSHREKMLKSINNNQSSFSMENLLSGAGMSPEEKEETFKLHQHMLKRSPSPIAQPEKIDEEDDRLSPALSNDKNDMFLRFNNCLRSRMCSNCGRIDCNFLQCRVSDSIKDTKPVLKFSVSAILGDEKLQQRNSSGECINIIMISFRYFQYS